MFQWREDTPTFLLSGFAFVLFFVLLVFDSIGFRYIANTLVILLRGHP